MKKRERNFSSISREMSIKLVFIPIISLLLLGSLYIGSYGIMQSSLTKQLNDTSQDELGIVFSNVNVTAISATFIELNVTFDVNSTNTLPNTRFSLKQVEIDCNNETTSLAYIDSESQIFNLRQLPFSKIINFSILDASFINRTLQDLFENNGTTLEFNGQIHFLGLGAIYPPFKVSFISNFSLEQLSSNISDFIEYEISEISINIFNLAYSLNLQATIDSPLNFTIEITSISGNLSFDDRDGYGYLPPMNNIYFATFHFDWEDQPLILPPNNPASKNMTLEGKIDGFPTAFRLLNEFEENQLEINFENLLIGLKIHEYSFSLQFSVSNIFIPTENLTL